MTKRRLISSGSPFEERYAYSRAVVQGDWCFCSGTTGYDYKTMSMPDDPAEQTRNIFETVKAVLEEAGFSLADVVRINAIVTDPAHWHASDKVLQEYLGDVRPANMTFVADLLTPEMKVEIEFTAYKGG